MARGLHIAKWAVAIALAAPLTWVLSTLFWMEGPPIFAFSMIAIALADFALLFFLSRRGRLDALKLALMLGLLLALLIFLLGLSAEGLTVGSKDIAPLTSEFAILLATLCGILGFQSLLVSKAGAE